MRKSPLINTYKDHVESGRQYAIEHFIAGNKLKVEEGFIRSLRVAIVEYEASDHYKRSYKNGHRYNLFGLSFMPNESLPSAKLFLTEISKKRKSQLFLTLLENFLIGPGDWKDASIKTIFLTKIFPGIEQVIFRHNAEAERAKARISFAKYFLLGIKKEVNAAASSKDESLEQKKNGDEVQPLQIAP